MPSPCCPHSLSTTPRYYPNPYTQKVDIYLLFCGLFAYPSDCIIASHINSHIVETICVTSKQLAGFDFLATYTHTPITTHIQHNKHIIPKICGSRTFGAHSQKGWQTNTKTDTINQTETRIVSSRRMAAHTVVTIADSHLRRFTINRPQRPTALLLL